MKHSDFTQVSIYMTTHSCETRNKQPDFSYY